MPAEINHPLFARLFDRLSRVMEPGVGPHRDELLEGLVGRVLEIGPGNGINFHRYPATVNQVVAIEPEPYLRTKAERSARTAPIPVTVQPGSADDLDLADDSFDAAVACLVLCSVPDQAKVLTELRRVLRAGGELRFLEHVRASNPAKARLQVIADRSAVWPYLGGGCHCSRETAREIEAAGFRIDHVRWLDLGPSWMITNPHVLGRGVR